MMTSPHRLLAPRIAPSAHFRPRAILALLTAICLAATGAAQSSHSAGTISGVVEDGATHSYLAGAQASVAGTQIAAVVDRDGGFTLADVPVGPATVVISYLGYETQSFPVMVSSGTTTTVTANLSTNVLQMGAFKVEGPREGQARAINQQKAEIGKVDIISSDAIGNFPDQNAADALQRVSGISTQRVYGEGTTVTIRGAAPDLNTISVDGVSMMGNNFDGRSVALNEFPAQILASVEVVKTVTPDMDANAIGGTVQLKTKSAFDYDHMVASANVMYQYNSLSKTDGYVAGIAALNRFGKNQDWGVAVSASREHRSGVEENVDVKNQAITTFTSGGKSYTGYTPLTVEFADEDFDDYRTAGSFALEKKFGDVTKLYVRGTRTVYILKNGRPSLDLIAGTTLNPNLPVTIDSNTGNFQQYSLTDETAQRAILPRTLADDSSNLTAGGETQYQGWKIDYVAGYSLAYGETNVGAGAQFIPTGKQSVSWDFSNPTFPKFTQTAGTNLYDPSVYSFNQDKLKDNEQRSKGYTFKSDVERPIDLGSDSRLTLKAGFNVRLTKIDTTNQFAQYVAGTTPVPLIAPPYNGTLDSNPHLLGQYDLGPSPDPRGFQNYFLANLGNAALFSYNLGKSLSAAYTATYGLEEDVYSGYAMGTWTFKKLTLIGGLRYEGTGEDSHGYVQNAALATTNLARYVYTKYSNNYDNVMPGVLARYELVKDLTLRASWTNTLARPDTSSIAPAQTLTLQTTPTTANPNTITGGNPNLKAEKSNNVDAGVDYYLPQIGLVSVAYFYKDLDGPVYTSTSLGTYEGQPTLYTVFNNAGKASLRGWEFTYQQNLTFLPGPLSGLGVYGNWTIVDSHVNVPTRPGEQFSLFNQANKIGNVAVSYQKYGLYTRLSWNYTGAYLLTLNGPGLDEYQAPFRVLDLLVTYQLTQRWSLKATINNIRNSPVREYFHDSSRMGYYGIDGRILSGGVNFAF